MAELWQIIWGGIEADDYFECSCCHHRIGWNIANIDALRYCWWCGEEFGEKVLVHEVKKNEPSTSD